MVVGFRLWSRHQLLWVLMSAAFFVRLVAVLLLSDSDPITAQLWEYGDIAREYINSGSLVRTSHMLDGSTVGPYPTAFMPPLPIFLWISIFSVFGDNQYALVAFLALNLVLSTAIVYYVFLICEEITGSTESSFFAGFILAVFPTFAASVATYHAIQLYLFLFLFGVHLAISSRTLTLKQALALGLIGGLAALTRTEYIILFGAVFFSVFVVRKQYKQFFVATLCAALVVVPWTARNYIIFDQFIPVANSTGYNFFKGFNAQANGSGNWVDEQKIALKTADAVMNDLKNAENFEIAFDALLMDEAKKFMVKEPVQAFVVLPVKKLILFWSFDKYDPMSFNVFYQIALWVTFILSLFGLSSIWNDRDRFKKQYAHSKYKYDAVLAIFISQSVIICFYAVHLRYRMNVDPFLICLAGIGCSRIIKKTTSRGRSLVE
jgi:hypothetical protein